MSKLTIQLPGSSDPVVLDYQVEGNCFEVLDGGHRYAGTFELTGPGEGWLEMAGKIQPFYMIRQGENLQIWLGGQTHRIQLVDTSRRPGGAGAGAPSKEIKAPMPGTVLKILAKAGDAVDANQPLVIMESMKMEMTLSAPQADTVEEIRCSEGQLVDMNSVLVRLKGLADS